jgi:hypothetical protein
MALDLRNHRCRVALLKKAGTAWAAPFSGAKKATREQTVAEIATRYREFVDQFERASIALPS